MSRIAIAVLALSLCASPAAAAVSKTEKGVRVWRGAPIESIAAPTLKESAARPCDHRTIVVVDAGWPGRRLATHRWTGAAFDKRLPLTTTGFFADRMADGY